MQFYIPASAVLIFPKNHPIDYSEKRLLIFLQKSDGAPCAITITFYLTYSSIKRRGSGYPLHYPCDRAR